MNVATSRFLIRFRRAVALTAVSAAGFSGVSCVTYPPPGDDNVFIEDDGRPRYGYGGSQSPNYRPESRPAPPVQPAEPRKKTPPPPVIKRDPNNTTVDVTPPPRKERPASPPPEPRVTPSAPDEPAAPPPPPPEEKKPAMREDLPFGQPVIGRPGLVYSPYAPTKGFVDVKGTPSGTKVECPYTLKFFRVP